MEGFTRVMLKFSPLICGAMMPVQSGFAVTSWAAVGIVAGKTVSYVGERTKNRSRGAAAALSIVATIIGSLLLIGVWVVVRFDSIDDSWSNTDYQSLIEGIRSSERLFNGIFLIFFFFGIGYASWHAVQATQKTAGSTWLCEVCKQPMGEIVLRSGSWENGERLLMRSQRADFAGLAEVIQTSDGKDIGNSLYMCSSCHRGFLESTAYFAAKWRSGFLREHWLFYSRQTSPEESQFLLDTARITDNPEAESPT
jgi:hypothetical protein